MSSKQTAIAKSTSVELTSSGLMSPDGAISSPTPAELAALMDAGHQFEAFVKLEPGQLVRGKLIGQGPPQEVETPATGEIRPVATWLLEVRPGLRVRIMGGHQIDAELTRALELGKVGGEVVIFYNGKVETRRGNHVNDFRISVKSPPSAPVA